MGLEPLVIQLEQVRSGVGQNGGNAGVLAVHDRQVNSDVDRVEIVLVHADGVILTGSLTLGNGQRNGLAVLEQVEAEAAQLAGGELVPIGIAHAGGTGILELKAHGENEGVGEEVLVVERQINAILAVTGSVLSGGLGAVAAVSPHIDREVGRAEERLVVQQGRADLAAGVLVGADGDIEQVEVSAVSVQAVNVGPHELCARIAGVACHFEHTVGHHLGHLDDRVNADALVGGVPPTLVAREDSAEGGHLVAEVRGERAAGRANGIGDIHQVGGAVKLGGIILDAGTVAGILQRGQQVVVRQVQRGVGELGGSAVEREALLLECRDHSTAGSVVVGLVDVQASDIHRDGELAVGIEAGELIAALDAAHGREGHIGNAVVGVAEELAGDAQVLTDVRLALFAVAEEQVRETGSSALELGIGGERFVAVQLQEETGMTFIHPYDDELVIAGQGSIGLEILDQLPDVEAVIVPISGGGLISGVAFAIKSLRPEVKVYGVQAAGAASMYKAFHDHKYETLDHVSTFADGIAVKTPGENTYELISKYVDDIVTVSEDEIATAILTLIEKQKLIAEGAGATPVAAALFDKLPIKGKKTVCVVSGGNIDVNILSRVITRGQVTSGRRADLVIALQDRPGQLREVSEIVSSCGANVVGVQHNRSDADMDITGCFLRLELETRDAEQINEIRAKLTKAGFTLIDKNAAHY